MGCAIARRLCSGLNLRGGAGNAQECFCFTRSLQSALEIEDSINAAWVIANSSSPLDSSYCQLLNDQLHPSLEDFGLQLDHHQRVFPDRRLIRRPPNHPLLHQSLITLTVLKGLDH